MKREKEKRLTRKKNKEIFIRKRTGKKEGSEKEDRGGDRKRRGRLD